MKGNEKTYGNGLAQLSLVEHSLCPLDRQSSLVPNLVHAAKFRYSDVNRKRRTAQARVVCPLGLSACDELYLWGLLALTMSQPEERAELVATPHWCLRQLGIIDSSSGRGGVQYRQFRQALLRLSATSYVCDAFYDPVRGEHREVSFHFFSYSLPIDNASSRAWRISWDPTFFDLVRHKASRLRFDLEIYRKLDPAARRLFLFLTKVFYRRRTLPQFDLRYIGVDVLGFSPGVAPRDLRMKVLRCLKRLDAVSVVQNAAVRRIEKDRYVIQANRGSYFARHRIPDRLPRTAQPVMESLLELGFDSRSADRLVRRYPAGLLEEWADITQAKIERDGANGFTRSPMAYFVDSVSKAHRGLRTAPDWWQKVRKQEQQHHDVTRESQILFDRIRSELFGTEEKNDAVPESSLVHAGDILKSHEG